MLKQLQNHSIFPKLDTADTNGLLALGGELTTETLLDAYSHGIFPWPISDESPLAWFSPDPRGILEYQNLHIPRSLKKIINKHNYKITFNQEFKTVVKNCASVKNISRGKGTWITKDIIDGYTQLFEQGFAYSIECWHQINNDYQLTGGIYGVKIGSYASGESMFYHYPNASKIALISLMEYFNSQGITWLDTQMVTPIVKNLGGIDIPRNLFVKKLQIALHLADGCLSR